MTSRAQDAARVVNDAAARTIVEDRGVALLSDTLKPEYAEALAGDPFTMGQS